MKKLLASVAILSCFVAWSNPVNLSQAESVAKSFIGTNTQLSATMNTLTPARHKKALGQTHEPYYVFNNANGRGYVIVSGDDTACPILGYSTTGTFDFDNMPDNMRQWMKLNELYVNACRVSGRSPMCVQSVGSPVVSPLLGEISWGQGEPFNDQCPTYVNEGVTTHYYVGCVATAATQIMRFHNYPQQGVGSKTLVVNGQQMVADFGNTTYDWPNMLVSYKGVEPTAAQRNAVSTLAMHFGVAVDMEYMPSGSGAHSMMVPAAYRDFFNYDHATTMRKRDYYSGDEWLQLIKDELDAGRPVYYAAASEVGSSGHAFVCDGYDTENFVHINWGWQGTSDGYFLVNHLDPDDLGIGGGTGGYNLDQEIITGIQPPTEGTVYERPLYSGLSVKLITQNADNFGIMMTIENFDTKAFNGNIGAALVRDGEIVKVLKINQFNIAGFANGRTGLLAMQTMYDIPKSVAGVEDGDAQVWLTYREDDQSPWQIMKFCRGRDARGMPYVGYFNTTVVGGKIMELDDSSAKPEVQIMNELKPEGDIYKGGSALFVLDLKNNSPVVRLRDIVIRFQSVDDESVVFEANGATHVNDASRETVRLLVDLDPEMPEGKYTLTAYEKNFPDYPFEQMQQEVEVELLPESLVPVMRLTQSVQWRRADGEQTACQGDNIYFALNTRNYAAEGNVGVILNLVNVDDPSKSYIYQQSNTTVTKGESKTLTFYRKLPVDPGIYRVVISYVTDDGNIAYDSNNDAYPVTLEVGEANNIYLNAVAIDLPDRIVKGERMKGSITLSAPDDHNGYVYVRMRQYTLTNGGIIYMGNQQIPAGQEKTINIAHTVDFEPGKYLILVEAKRGNTEGTIGNYENCYKLIEVLAETPSVPCDVTGDGNVDIADVNEVINVMLGKSTNPKADINGDGSVDIADVNAVINAMLGK